MQFKIKTASIAVLLFAAACAGNGENTASDTEKTAKEPITIGPAKGTVEEVAIRMEKDGLVLYSHTASPSFDGAKLTTLSPTDNAAIAPGNVVFSYQVDAYELGAQTPGAVENGLANSGMGQHIHAILNNEPYMAHYKPGFEKELAAGRYILLSFLSRSYHESIKHAEAYDLLQFTVGDTETPPADLTAPHLFYSRPKGTYTGMDTEKLLLDFYLVNCDLSPDGYQVKATINGTEFMLSHWLPYVIEGLPKGEATITLELLDAEGNTVDSPFNPVTRTVSLEEGEA